MRGAEAIVRKDRLLGRAIVVKERIPKNYRIKELDAKLRKERTKQEARLLQKAKLANVSCPIIMFVDEFSIGMTQIKGKRPKRINSEAGRMLAKLHNAGIIHGDFTPANLLENDNVVFAIDFGLGFFSDDVEDKAIDVLTMLKAIKNNDEFLSGYEKESKEFGKIMERVKEVKKRARYS